MGLPEVQGALPDRVPSRDVSVVSAVKSATSRPDVEDRGSEVLAAIHECMARSTLPLRERIRAEAGGVFLGDDRHRGSR